MKDVLRQIADTEQVAKSAKYGTPRRVVQPKNSGAWAYSCAETASFDAANECNILVPAKSAWLPADNTEVRRTAFIPDAAIPRLIELNGGTHEVD